MAVGPTTEALVATSEAGPLLSTDGGENFDLLRDAPVLVLVDWTQDGGLVGVSPSGQVHTTDDATGGWSARAGLEDAVQALTTTASGAIYVSTHAELLRSDDGGSSFSTVASY